MGPFTQRDEITAVVSLPTAALAAPPPAAAGAAAQ